MSTPIEDLIACLDQAMQMVRDLAADVGIELPPDEQIMREARQRRLVQQPAQPPAAVRTNQPAIDVLNLSPKDLTALRDKSTDQLIESTCPSSTRGAGADSQEHTVTWPGELWFTRSMR